MTRHLTLMFSALVIVLVASEQASAQIDERAIEQLAEALSDVETQTWSTTAYMRFVSTDGQRSWLRKEQSDTAFKSPNLYRDTRFHDDGSVRLIEIVDTNSNKTLRIDPVAKTANWASQPINVYAEGSPFGGILKMLKSDDLENAGQRQENGRTIDVYRYRRKKLDDRSSVEIWIDANAHRLVSVRSPGSDQFDPAADPDRDRSPGGKSSRGRFCGWVRDGIVFNPRLDDALFKLEPPDGYRVID